MTADVVVIGASRGLGAALVREILHTTSCRVYGVSRTAAEKIPACSDWRATGRYTHLQLDIADAAAAEGLSSLAENCTGKICVIYNAAHIERDYVRGRRLDLAAFERVNRVGLEGLRNVLAAFEQHLVTRGGTLVGVSSFWGRLTPVSLPYVAYPATKAYLDSLLRSLRYLWPPEAQVTAVTIGNIKEGSGRLPEWFIPSYQSAARHIVRRLFVPRPPDQIEYPCWHAVVYKYCLRALPERWLPLLFGAYLKMEAGAGIPPHGSQ